MERLANILHLGIKELRSLQHDLVLVLLIRPTGILGESLGRAWA